MYGSSLRRFERLIARVATAFLLLGCFSTPGLGDLRGRGMQYLHARAGDRDPVRGGVALPPSPDRLPDRLRDGLHERARHRDGDAVSHGLQDGKLHRHEARQ